MTDYSGQKDFYYPDTHKGSVSVIGAGGIGSPTIMGLARLGIPKIYIFDDDIVEERNITSQNFDRDDVYGYKAQKIAEKAKKVANPNANIQAIVSRVNHEHRFSSDIIVSAVDSMKSRKEIYEAAKNSLNVNYIIDGRLGGQLIILYVVNIREKDQVEWYTSDDIMFDDAESESQMCTARAVIDVSHSVSALIIRSVRLILTGKPVEKLQMMNMETLRIDANM